MNENHPIIKKIIEAEPNTYVIYFDYGCGYSMAALNLLRNKNVSYKGYDIKEINGQMNKLLDVLAQNANLINFDTNHRTKPIIFINGKFLGGYQELAKYLNH